MIQRDTVVVVKWVEVDIQSVELDGESREFLLQVNERVGWCARTKTRSADYR
jgi:hypothetical protein